MFFATNQTGVFKNKEGFTVTFLPFIKRLKLTGHYVMLHWNKKEKKWGFYDGNNNKYYLVDANQVPPITAKCKLVDVFNGTLPSCVLLYQNCQVSINQSILTLQEVSSNDSNS